MKPPRTGKWRRFVRWIGFGVAAVLAVVTPKCGVCVLAWWAVLTGAGVELCGAPAPKWDYTTIVVTLIIMSFLGIGMPRLWRITRRGMRL